jgi:hypothetical protein
MMLFGQVPIQHLKLVLTNFWNAPVECDDPQFYAVEIVGLIKDVQVISVSFFFIAGVYLRNCFFSFFCFLVCIDFERTEESFII